MEAQRNPLPLTVSLYHSSLVAFCPDLWGCRLFHGKLKYALGCQNASEPRKPGHGCPQRWPCAGWLPSDPRQMGWVLDILWVQHCESVKPQGQDQILWNQPASWKGSGLCRGSSLASVLWELRAVLGLMVIQDSYIRWLIESIAETKPTQTQQTNISISFENNLQNCKNMQVI